MQTRRGQTNRRGKVANFSFHMITFTLVFEAIASLDVTSSLTHSCFLNSCNSLPTIWSPTDLYGPLWSYMFPYGSVWSLLVLVCPIWSLMVLYGPVWSSLVLRDPVCSHTVTSHLWSHMVHMLPYGPVQCSLLWSVWSCMVPYGHV